MTWATAVHIGLWCNTALASAALLLLFTTVRHWKQRSAGNRFLWLGLAVLLLNVIFGSAEQLIEGPHEEWRTAVTTVALAYVIGGLWTKRRGQWLEDEAERRLNGRTG